MVEKWRYLGERNRATLVIGWAGEQARLLGIRLHGSASGDAMVGCNKVGPGAHVGTIDIEGIMDVGAGH